MEHTCAKRRSGKLLAQEGNILVLFKVMVSIVGDVVLAGNWEIMLGSYRHRQFLRAR